MIETKLDKSLKICNTRIIVVLLLQTANYSCCYRVYTSEGGFVDYIGFDNVPQLVKDWMKARNTWNFVVPSAMVISGVEVV